VSIKPLILIIEDDETICNFTSAVLTSNDYNVVKTGKGREGLEMNASHVPDLILLDLGLPDMDRSIKKYKAVVNGPNYSCIS